MLFEMKIYASVVLVFGLVLSSCSYQLSTHNFYYHGTDSIGDQEDFYYVKQGLTGTSRTTYTVRGGGDVREGLVADAKADMFANFPLGPNQMYANLSVDIIQTERGVTVDGQKSPNRIDLQCTVSADIIQYGKAPEMGAQPKANVQTIGNLTDDTPLSTESEANGSAEIDGKLREGDLIWFGEKAGEVTRVGSDWYRISVKGKKDKLEEIRVSQRDKRLKKRI